MHRCKGPATQQGGITRGLRLMSKTLAFEAHYFSHGFAAWR